MIDPITASRVTVQVSPLECTISQDRRLLKGLPNYDAFIRRRLPDYSVSVDDVLCWDLGGRTISVKICDITIGPQPASQGLQPVQSEHNSYRIDRKTTIIDITLATPSALDYDMDNHCQLDVLSNLVEIIRSGFDCAPSFQQLGIPVSKSVLLHGVSGIGKATLVRRAAQLIGCHILSISIQDLLVMKEEWDLDAFKNYNPLHLMVNKSIAAAPSILMIRDLDSIGKGNDKLLEVLANEISRVPDTEKVCVVGLARQLLRLPEQLKKPDIFRQHLTFPIPTMTQRKDILKPMLLKMKPVPMSGSSNAVDDFVTHIALRTSGFVARDLKMICRNAALKSRRTPKTGDVPDEDTLTKHFEKLDLAGSDGQKPIHWSDFEYALDNYQPSQQMEVESSLPKRDWQEVGGYDKIKQRIRQSTLVPLLQPETFMRLGISPPSGLLLYGPSGCGKTMMVQALASESMMNVISINGPGIFSKYLGETENKIRRLFSTAKKIAPCLVFIDELDAIGSRRGWDGGGDTNGGVNERVLSTLLNEMDGVEGRKGVIVIGCTNRPHQIDDAILRPGRLDQLIYVDMPTLDDRKDIITRVTTGMAVDSDVDASDLAKETDYCTGADLDYLFREAGTAALREDIGTLRIAKRHLDQVLGTISERAKQRVDNGSLECYKKFQNDHSV